LQSVIAFLVDSSSISLLQTKNYTNVRDKKPLKFRAELIVTDENVRPVTFARDTGSSCWSLPVALKTRKKTRRQTQ